MNYTVLVLGIWCVMQVAIAIWGLGMLTNNCQNLSLYSRLRTLLTTSAVTATIFFANLMCNKVCYEGDENTSIWVALFTLVSSIIIIVMELQVKSDIDDCAKSTDNYKLVLLYGGIVPSLFPLLYSLYMIYTWFSTVKERQALRSREKDARKKLAQQEKLQKQEAERAERTRKAEEAEKRAEAIEQERRAKESAKRTEQLQKIEEAKRQRDEATRKATGRYTAEEKIEMAREAKKKIAVKIAKDKVAQLDERIRALDPATQADQITTLGDQLKKAKEEVRTVESGEQARSRGLFFGGNE